jgi:hypothetical protein
MTQRKIPAARPDPALIEGHSDNTVEAICEYAKFIWRVAPVEVS